MERRSRITGPATGFYSTAGGKRKPGEFPAACDEDSEVLKSYFVIHKADRAVFAGVLYNAITQSVPGKNSVKKCLICKFVLK